MPISSRLILGSRTEAFSNLKIFPFGILVRGTKVVLALKATTLKVGSEPKWDRSGEIHRRAGKKKAYVSMSYCR